METVVNDQVKILIVDDMKENLIALEALLKRDDVEIFKAKSGIEALEFMISHEFALALIDVQMPGMSGFELGELMRGANKSKHIPIIFVSATAKDQSFLFKGYESGAVDFLQTPLDTHAVKSKVNIFIELYRQKRALKNQVEVITRSKKDQEELLFQLKKSQSELLKAKDSADQASDLKSTFLANMSHEIRTPLAAILGYAELVSDPTQTREEIIGYSDRIRKNGEQLMVLIDEILDLSKVEAGKLEIEIIRFALLPELTEIFANLRKRFKNQGVLFNVKYSDQIPEFIRGCPHRLRQILNNIVGNALKFTPKGKVNIDVSMKQGPVLFFEITDTGCGMNQIQQERLFQPFSQADRSVTRKFGGTGLGLVIARQLSRALGGDVVLTRSAVGMGSTFTVGVNTGSLDGVAMLNDLNKFELDPEIAVQPSNVGKNRTLAGIRILLVEDGPDNQLIMNHFLTSSGAIVEFALNGLEAIEMAQTHNFDLVFMDIQMPKLDGYEATRRLTGAGYKIPIVALTAHAMIGEKEKCLAAGCAGYLTKPITSQLLIETVIKFAKKNCGSSPSEIFKVDV